MPTLQEALQTAHADIHRLIAPLPPAAWEQPRAIGLLSLAQWLALETAWLGQVTLGLREIQRHKKPTRLMQLAQDDTPLRQALAETETPDPATLLIDFDDAIYRLCERIAPFTPRDLREASRIGWLGNRSLATLISELTLERLHAALPVLVAHARRHPHDPA